MAHTITSPVELGRPSFSPLHSESIPDAEISHFDELVRAGRIIAILAWADRMASINADFRPISNKIEILCKTLNLRGLMELSDNLRGSPASTG